MSERLQHTALITDFDNTLYDWFEMWHQSFGAMFAEIKRISGISEDVLIPEIRELHQRHHTSEYAFLIEELPSLKRAYPNQKLVQVFDEAVHAYRSARKASLRLYDGVRETLQLLRSKGVLIVVHTESLAYYTNFRIRRLGLDELVDIIYSPPDHDVPANSQNKLSSSEAALLHAKHRYLPKGVVKPSPDVLIDIIAEIGRDRKECVYLGDSPMKDMAMAQSAGIIDVFAKYGVAQQRSEYSLLRKVSHWTEGDVQREIQINLDKTVTPTHTICNFSEIATFFGA
jgi:phosphoglycolate phosphatase-like HAD superfamily hydrolase